METASPTCRRRSEDTAPQQGDQEISFQHVLVCIIITLFVGTAASFRDSGAAGVAAPSADSRAQELVFRVSAPERCRSARLGLAWYRLRYVQHIDTRNRHLLALERQLLANEWPPGRHPRNCADARYLTKVWTKRAFRARIETKRIAELRDRLVLDDFSYGDGNHAWFKAIDEVQTVFPGTKSWLLSCSWAEGKHGRWVGYSGVSFSISLRDSDTVGGNMQFRFSTFKGMYRRAYEHVVKKGFLVPPHLRSFTLDGLTRAWLSSTAQALAAGWARYTGNDDRHWEASWSNGCR